MKTMISREGKNCEPRRIPANAKLTVTELQKAHDNAADQYDKRIWFDQNILGVARLRKKLLSKASGKILDVACGTGQNFPMFVANSNVMAIDLSPRMIELARKNASSYNLQISFAVMNAEHLEFEDESFDTVVSALSTCTFPDPVRALLEMKRVCKSNGMMLLLEHGHSSVTWLANYQDQHEYQHYENHAGCRWNQDPLTLVQSAGMKVLKSKQAIFGMYHLIEAKP